MAASPNGFTIRPFRTLAEFRACVALQEEVWGEGFSERVPVALLKVAQRVGGIAAGAYDADGVLVGFVFGITGWEDGSPVHWSDMLAVRPGVRGSGLGVRLKAYQRDVLLRRGVERAYWTFDPLESRNAWMNLGRLGAVSREYVVDMYGETDSVLHRGLGTDRLIALWELGSARVAGRLERTERPPGSGALEGARRVLAVEEPASAGWPRPGRLSPPARDARRVRVPIPADVQALKADDPGLAVAWREAVRGAMEPLLSTGWEARELVRAGNLSEYLLVLETGGTTEPGEEGGGSA